MTDCTINADPGLFYPTIMMGQRDVQIFPLYGQYKFNGNLAGPIFPSNSVPLLAAGFGKDGGQGKQLGGFGVTITTTTGSATTITTAITAAQVAHGDGPQISYTTTVLTDTNASFAAAIIGSVIETFSGKTGTVTAQTATTLTVASWTGGTPVAGESYNVGPNTIVVASATGYVAGTSILQLDVNNTATPTTSEVRKVTTIVTTTLTLDHPVFYPHLSGAPVVRSTGATPLYQHFFVPGNLLDSLTIEKDLGQFQSEQFQGCRVAKYGMKAASTNTEAGFTATVEGAGASILTTPTTLSVVNEAPFVFAESALTLFGTATQEITSISIDIENGVKPTYVANASHAPAFITPTLRKASGQITVVFTSLNDAVKGYFAGMGVTGAAVLSGAIDATFTHPTLNTAFQVHLNKCRISKLGDVIKAADVILQNLSFEAEFDLGATPNSLGYASTTSGATYLPY